jgi:hypothetical protein
LQGFARARTLPTPAVAGGWDRRTFWAFADEAKSATEALAEQRMRVLPTLPVAALRVFCTQYRFFTIDYIADLALLVARLPFGGLRSLLGQILAEELGAGDPKHAHPELYDAFLSSIGVVPALRDQCLPPNRTLLQELTQDLLQRSPAFGVGLRGMGGECLCQTYLAVMYEHLRMHPYLREHEHEIAWEFWTIHAGEDDIRHGELTRAAIDGFLQETPEAMAELAQGYARSIGAWNKFWENIFAACAPAGPRPS